MNLLNKLTLKNLKLNKKRTIVTIIGIMLSVALITAVSTMYSSMIKSLINFEVNEKGDFHVAYHDVGIDDISKIKYTREVEKIYLTKNIGYARIEESKNEYKPYAYVKGFTKDSLESLSVKLIEGRLPRDENEIVIPSHLKTNGRVFYKIGDEIKLNIGKRFDLENNIELNQIDPYSEECNEEIIDTKTKTYKIVGVIERPATNIEEYSAPGYTFITCMSEDKMDGVVDVYVKYTKKGSREYTKVTSAILEVDYDLFNYAYTTKYLDGKMATLVSDALSKAKYTYDINTYLITLENNPLKDYSVGSLGVVVLIVILIIIVTSVFCIKNSFDISITEKIKQYGMLRSVGATKKQIRENVFYEATILGSIGIPLGVFSGIIASFILVKVSNILLFEAFADNLTLVLSFSPIVFLISIILGFVAIFLSAFRGARKASHISPIDSIRNSASIKIKSKKVKSPKFIKNIFGEGGDISYKNLKRNKKKYRTTITSIIVSSATFIALSYFIGTAFCVINDEVKTKDFNISLHKNRSNYEFEKVAYQTANLDNIDDYAIYKSHSVEISNPRYNKDYIKFGNFGSSLNDKDGSILLVGMEDYQYKKYIKKLGLKYDDIKDKGILIDYQTLYNRDKNGKDYKRKLREFNYQKNDKISIYDGDKALNLTIGCVTQEKPFGLDFNGVLVINESLVSDILSEYQLDFYYLSSNPNKLQDEIEILLGDYEYNLNNIYENAKIMSSLYTLIAIFLYGFIIVISLIGITNIFNTITTNMELRKGEFAMLKSIGMTKCEFNNMIRLESIFMGFKALIIGVPIGVLLSFFMYKTLNMDMDIMKFNPPYVAIFITILVVYLLITILMKYSMSRINKQNTIETIRCENI